MEICIVLNNSLSMHMQSFTASHISVCAYVIMHYFNIKLAHLASHIIYAYAITHYFNIKLAHLA